MTVKIFRSIFITAIVVLRSSFAIAFGFTYNSYDELSKEELKRECEYVCAGYEEYGEDYLDVLDIGGARITHISKDGRVVYDSYLGDAVSELESYGDREEFLEAKDKGEGFAKRVSSTTGERRIYCAMLLSDGTVIRVSSRYIPVGSMLLGVALPATVLLFAVLAFAFFVAVRLAGGIVKPINELNLENPESSKVYDELKPIISKLGSQNYKISRQMAELKTRQTEFNSITSNMSEGMIVMNSRAEILFSNRAARDILGAGGEMPRSVLALDNSQGFRNAIMSALKGANGFDTIKKDGRHYSLLVTPVMQDEKPDGAVVVIIDDTEKEQREQLRREFTSNISHELKTPLTSISGFAELIRDGIADGEDAQRFAGNIHKEAKRLITLVGDIIRLTQLDGGEIPFDEGAIDLFEICSEVIERISNVAESKGVALKLDCCEKSLVIGNRQILEELVYNLVDNGIKYNKQGGYVNISVQKQGNNTILKVSDSGIGIPKSEQSRVFERFYRVDKSHSKDIGGTGLGLSIVKHAVAYHKASVSLESEVGVGTCVSVVF